jgi:flagellar M-ring protein FliF
MPPGLKNTIEQAKDFWASRNGRQRAMLLGGAVGSLLLLVLFVRMIGGPDYKPLLTGLEPADAQALSAKLHAMGIPHRAGPDGKSISVPADKLDMARMQTSAQGDLHSGRMGFELFDKVSWGQTEFDEKVTYQRALEGELEKSIQTLNDVERARVHLVMASDSVFVDRQRGAKASVILKLRRGTLSKDAGLAISRLVSGAVDDLRPEDVSIVDADSSRSIGIGQDNLEGGGSSSDLSSRLISTLEPVVGAGKIRASVNVDYDQGTTDESQEKYDPTVSALLTQQRSEDSAGGSPVPGGVPGTASNIPTAEAKNTPPQGASQSSKTESAQYGVNKTLIHTVTPAGRVQRITAAILVDDAIVKNVQKGKATYTRRKRTTDELNQIRELAQAAIGFDAKRGDSISVQNLSFDVDTDLDTAPSSWTNEVQKAVTDYSSVLKPAALLLLFVMAYIFLFRPVQKHALAMPLRPKEDPLLTAGIPNALPRGPDDEELQAIRVNKLREETAELIKLKPMHTARAVQTWLREES